MSVREHDYWVYLLANKRKGTLYVGVSNNLAKRVWEHKNGIGAAFTRKYGVNRLVWYAQFNHIDLAIEQEKRMKKWRRTWKIDLIEKMNPNWDDLYETLNS